MFDAFFNTLNNKDISDLNYVVPTSYRSEEEKEEVIQKLDWIIMKLNKLGRNGEDDLDIVKEIKEQIEFNECSLDHRGIEYLNKIAVMLKSTFGI